MPKILAFLTFSFLLTSCEFWQQPVREYLEYWTTTCQVGKIEYITPWTELNGAPNLSALNPIEINIYLVNPKGYNILRNPTPGKNCFKLQDGSGNLISEGYSETALDNNTSIKIRAKLSDTTEGQTIKLSGCIWPENRASWGTEETLRESFPELFYETTFVQNTPPDNPSSVTTLQNGTFGDTDKHFLSFTIPIQRYNRNKGSKYEIKYWLRDGDDNSLTYQGSKILTLSDNKNPDSTSTTFQYYFDEQVPHLFYEYTVQVLGPRGLKSEVFATEYGPGVHQLMDPEITILKDFNGLEDEDHFECIEVASDDEEIFFTASPANPDEEFKVTVDDVEVTQGNYKVSRIGRHTIVATSIKDGARTVNLKKNIRIVKTPSIDPIDLGSQFNGKGQDTNGFKYIEVDKTTDKVSYSIMPKEEGTTVSGTIDNTPFDETTDQQTGQLGTEKSHTLTAIIHKQYCKDVTFTTKVKVVQKLQAPSYEFKSNGLTNNPTGVKTGNFEWIEVPDGSTYVTYAITAASGCTMEVKKDYPNVSTTTVNSNTHMDNLVSLGGASYRDYTLTITVKKPYQNDKTFYKYIRLVQALQEPTLRFYKHESNDVITASSERPEESGYSNYTCYDLPLTLSGTGKANFEVSAGSGESVTVKIDGSTSTANGSGKRFLELGGHTITMVVSKTNYSTQTYSKDVYIQGILEPVTIQYSPRKSGSTIEWTNIPKTNDLQYLKFSYLTYDSMPIKVIPGNTDNTISVTIYRGSTSIDSNTITDTYTNNLFHHDTAYTIAVNQSRLHCKSSIQESRRIQVQIKPVTITVGDTALKLNFDEAGDSEIWGKVYLRKNSGTWDLLREFKKAKFGDEMNWDSYGHESLSYTLYAPTETVAYKSEGLYESDTGNKDWIGDVNVSKNLTTLKSEADPLLYAKSSDSGGSHPTEHRVKLNLAD
ncbi:MAG: hypothetical protein J5857_00620 [Treponema sp.]|nr:hypothetical protein [Treponema sp.]